MLDSALWKHCHNTVNSAFVAVVLVYIVSVFVAFASIIVVAAVLLLLLLLLFMLLLLKNCYSFCY